MKFLIGYPVNVSIQYSGGLQVIKKLVDVLTELGQTVYIIGSSFKNEKTIQINNITEVDLNETVVIYPEVVVGNPFKGKNVVRWILYHTKFSPNPPSIYHKLDYSTSENLKRGIEFTWTKNDEYFYFNDFFETIKKREKKILKTYNFRLNEFYDFGLDRDGYCHLFHKKNIDREFPNKYGSEHIPLNNWKGIIEMFNRKKYFLTYDDSTYYVVAAALCGCVPIILGVEDKEKVKNGNPLLKYGVAFGFEDIDYAEKTINNVRENLIEEEKKSIESVEQFIYFCEKKFKK